MTLPLLALAQSVVGLLEAPLTRILEAYVSDLELRRKLQAEIQTQIVTLISRSEELASQVVLAEIKSEHWLTRSWRPLLMLLMMGFLVIAGVLLPFADLLAGRHVAYEPRWNALPDGFWDFLSIGMGGYIGGRSVEKVADMVFGGVVGKKTLSPASRH